MIRAHRYGQSSGSYHNTTRRHFRPRLEPLEVRALLAAGSLIGVDFDPQFHLPTNWNGYAGGPTPDALTGLVDEDGDPAGATLLIEFSDGQADADFVVPIGATVPAYLQPLHTIDGSVYDNKQAHFTWRGLQPLAEYDVYVFGLAVDNNNQVVTISGETTVTFEQEGDRQVLWINGEQGDSTRTLDSFAEVIQASAEGLIEIEVSTLVQNLGLGGLAIRQRGIEPGGAIHGTKYHDIDGNGQRSATEPGLRGWTIVATDEAGNEYTTQTDARGNYWLMNLPPGPYTVTEVQQDGWQQTQPVSELGSPGVYRFLVASNQSIDGVDFGNRRDHFVEHDIFEETVAKITLITPEGAEEIVDLVGPSWVDVWFENREGEARDDDGNGREEVMTKLRELNLTGESPTFGTVEVRLNPNFDSVGVIEEVINNTPGILDVRPFAAIGVADSFFDVF
ncbi:MAG: hypothetical protein KDA60_22065, partial [Planctomycetales bacterium]|nr:hypothetical protein [Planctomycetales bacterium]